MGIKLKYLEGSGQEERRVPLSNKLISLFFVVILSMTCQNINKKEDVMTFEDDLEFLKKHTETILLSDKTSQAQIIVSPGLQGRVFTSTASGKDGMSFGWINYDHFHIPSI